MLDRVGMSGIETVLRRRSPEGELFLVPAKADAFVNLDDPEALGPWIATAMLPLWYALIGAAVCRAFEADNSDDTGAVANSCC